MPRRSRPTSSRSRCSSRGADGFRNYLEAGDKLPPEKRLLDQANLLSLTAPEMTVLVGGLRALGANHGGTSHGVLTDRPGTLTNDFFVNLLDAGTEWTTSTSTENVYEGRDADGASSGRPPPPTSSSARNSQLRAIAEVYGAADGEEKFVATSWPRGTRSWSSTASI